MTSQLVSAQVSVFASFIDNYIFSQKLNGVITQNCPTYKYTQGNARLVGGEAMVDLHPISRLHFQNSFSYVNSVQLNQPRESKYLPWTPAPRWNSELRYDLVRDGQLLNNTYVSASMECNLRQNHFYAANDTETATPSYTLVNFSAGTDLRINGHRRASLYLTANNIFNRAYQNHLSRLKYIGADPTTGQKGLFNMGRNFGVKLVLYVL